MNKLISAAARLRRHCPWYQAQTLESLKEYLTEEAQETLAALDEQNPDFLKNELGDLLFQIILFCQLASELGWFSMQDVVDGLLQKIIRRNPHVFGDLKLDGLDAVNRHWQQVKAREK
jgi:uncharacterized protein YabN with tetrapyrrole methylase and pyrophosphatase domain